MSLPDELLPLNEKIDVLIRIQAALAVKDMPTQKDKIVFLYNAGLKPSFIASLLGTTPQTVSVSMVRHKKSSSNKTAAKDE